MFKLEKFPIDDIYLGSLRIGGNEIIKKNKETVRRITDYVLSMKIEELIALLRQPVVANRRLGEAFHRYFVSMGYPILAENEFKTLNVYRDSTTHKRHKVLMMKGSMGKFKEFANDNLDCGVDKQLDVLLKVNGSYVIGEAKFVTNFGGHQNEEVKEALDFVNSSRGSATRIAILDGAIWYNTGNRMSQRVQNTENIVMSVLLFPDFIKNFGKYTHRPGK